MDSKSPYLDAIQGIPGNTAKEKYESLNRIIKQKIENKNAPGDFSSYLVPKVLEPLVDTEIAKISKNVLDIIVALKSEDATIINRALQAEWLFNGTNKSVTNFRYFSTHILPNVSLNTRTMIIKRLSQHLGHTNDYIVAQEFFVGLADTYDLKQAMPLLSACSESYVSEFIKDGNVRLPKKIVVRLFSKYPQVVVNYLKFGKPDAYKKRRVEAISVRDYLDILPKLIRNHVNDFIDIVSSFENPLDIKLGNKCAELFLKSKGIEALVECPRKYLPILSLKVVSTKLNKEQFGLMFRNLFPKTKEEFKFDRMLKYLEFQPQETKLPLITENFKDLYGIDLTSLLDKVTPQLLLMLPIKDRVEVAQKKLDLDSEMENDCEEFWICYLSTEDSIPRIKNLISKATLSEDRADLISKLIYTCKVNDSKDDLLSVLQYVTSERHKNEIPLFWYTVYSSLLKYFDLALLSEDHWTVLSGMIRRSYVKNHFSIRSSIPEKLLEKAIHYDLLNSIPIEKHLTILAELKILGFNSSFNILRNYPNYEKYCLEQFIEIIPRKFPDGNPIWEDNNLDTIQYLLRALYDYNERIIKTARKNQKIVKNDELLSLTSYPWLLERVKKFVSGNNHQRYEYKIEEMKSLLQNNERNLYGSWFPTEKETIVKVFEQEGLNLLKNDHGKILENWKEYFESIEKHVHGYVHTRRFLRKCTWYSDIPVKFLQESLKKLDEKNSRTIMILALLLRGPEFAEIIKPMVPVSDKMEIEEEDAKKIYEGACAVPPAINRVNPPPPLELVGQFCHGDYLSLGLVSLMNVGRRVPVPRVISFAKELVGRPISVKKHGIRLMCVVSPTRELCKFLGNLWNVEKHKSIREVIFKQGQRKFTTQPCSNTWDLMEYLIGGLTAEDIDCFGILKDLENVSNDYIKDYFEKALIKVEQLAQDGMEPKITNQLISNLLGKADPKVCAFFPEEYCRLLLQKFTFDVTIDDEILDVARQYAIDTFLLGAGNNIESRLCYFHDLLQDVIRKQWDQPHPQNFRYYPLKRMFANIVDDIVGAEMRIGMDLRILETMMNLFSTVLKPVQAPSNYLSLFFVTEFRKAGSDIRVFGLSIVEQLPKILNCFSVEMVYRIGSKLLDFLDLLKCKEIGKRNLVGDLAQVLTENESVHSHILAAIIIQPVHTDIADDLYKDILQKLRKFNHPSIDFVLNDHESYVRFEEVFLPV